MSAGAEEPVYVVLLGAPGSGKGTQAQALSELAGLAHVASGDLFREASRSGTELGRQTSEYMLRGELVPDSITVPLVIERLQAPDVRGGAILDGFPRTVVQAEALDRALQVCEAGIDLALSLRVPPEVLVSRLSGRWMCQECHASYHSVFNSPRRPGICDRCGGELYQRQDDQRETAERRLDVYFQSTEPLIDYYRRRGVLEEVNGDERIDRVRANLLAALERKRQ